MAEVLYISYNDALGNLGSSQIIPYLSGLNRFGHHFTLLSFEREEVNEEKKRSLLERNIEWKPLRYHQRLSLLATTYDVTSGIISSIRLIRKKKIKIIHARSYVPAFIGLAAAKFTGTKLIFDMRGFMADEYADAGNWSRTGFKYKLVKRFERMLIRYSDYFVTLTEAAKEIIIENFHLSKPVSVIPCCVDVDKFRNIHFEKVEQLRKELNLTEKRVVVYSGSLGGWYLTKEMVDFFEAAKAMDSSLHFLLLTNNDRDVIDHMLRGRGFHTSEYTILKAKPSEMPEYLSLADFSLAFIKPCFSKKASSPIKFGEYLTIGLPIVTNSGIGDSDSMIGDSTGALVKDFTDEEYKKAFSTVLKLLENKQETAANCREVVTTYLTLESGIQAYEKIYQSFSQEL